MINEPQKINVNCTLLPGLLRDTGSHLHPLWAPIPALRNSGSWGRPHRDPTQGLRGGLVDRNILPSSTCQGKETGCLFQFKQQQYFLARGMLFHPLLV